MSSRVVSKEKESESVLHMPNLKTVLMVEDVLKGSGVPLSRNEIKRRMPKKIMHQTLNVVLKYFEERGMVLIGSKGVLWIHEPGPKLKKALEKGIEV